MNYLLDLQLSKQFKDSKIVVFDTIKDMMDAVFNRKVDVMIGNSINKTPRDKNPNPSKEYPALVNSSFSLARVNMLNFITS